MQSTPPQKLSSKSWSLTLLYFLGTGILGGHRFYLGRKWSGSLQTLFFLSPLVCFPLIVKEQFGGFMTELALSLLLYSFIWYLADLCLLVSGSLKDNQRSPVKPKKGELSWLWQSLLLCVGLLLLQASLVFWWHGGVVAVLEVFRNGLGQAYPRLLLWALSTWAFGYTAIYVWREWFMVKEAGVVFLAQPLLLTQWSLLICWVDLLVFFEYLGDASSIDLFGVSLYAHYRFTVKPFLFVLGFAVLGGLWMLVSMAASFVRKTDLYKHQGTFGWCVLVAFCLGLALMGQLTSLFGLVVIVILVTISVVLLAPPFRQKMEEGASTYGQIRQVVSFSLLCFSVAGIALLFDAGMALLRYLARLNEVKSSQPWLPPSSSTLQPALVDWRVIVLALVCVGAVLGRLLWIHRKQFRWALHEAKWTFVTIALGLASVTVFSTQLSGWIVDRSSYELRSDEGGLVKHYKRTVLSPFVQKKMGLQEKTQITSLLSMARHFFGKKQVSERIWVGPDAAYVIDTRNNRIHLYDIPQGGKRPALTIEELLALYRRKRLKRLRLRSPKSVRERVLEARSEIRIAVDPATSMHSLCQHIRAFSKHGYKKIWLQTPGFRTVTIAGKSKVTIAHWHSHRLAWGKNRYQKGKQVAKDVLYNEFWAAALKAGKKVLRVCHR